MNLLKKIVAITTIASSLLMAAGPAMGATVEELEDQIADLLEQLATLQSQLADLKGETVSISGCTITSFDRNLAQGMSGDDVKCLQIILNSATDTQVAASGAGSPGNETTYFGSLTHAAVIEFQEKYASEILASWGLTAGTGYVGSTTRAKLNSLLTAVEEEEEEVPPAEEEEEEGVEGYLTATLYAVPADTTVYQGSSNNAVYGFQVKASLSDVTIRRVTLKFNKRPWLYVNHISLYDGANAVVGVDATSDAFEEVTAGSDYNLHLTGLSVKVAKGTTKVLTVKVSLPSVTHSTGAVTIRLIANGVRGVDGAGIQQYAPSSALSTRTFTVAAATTGNIEVSLNTGSPTEGAEIISTSDTTEDVVLAKVDLKAKYSDITITQIILAATDGISNAVSTVLPAVKLYDGDTALQTATGATSMTFDLSTTPVKIAKNATKTLTVKANVAKLATSYTTAGDYTAITLTGNATNITAEDGNYNTLTNSEISGTASGKNISFYSKAPGLALSSTSIKQVEGSATGKKAADWNIKLSVTALGGDIYVRKYDSTTTSNSGLVAEKQESSLGGTLSFSITSDASVSSNGHWVVYSGTTSTFTVSGYIPDGGTAGMNGAKITKVRWNTDDGTTWTDWDGSAAPFQAIPIAFKTDKVYVSN